MRIVSFCCLYSPNLQNITDNILRIKFKYIILGFYLRKNTTLSFLHLTVKMVNLSVDKRDDKIATVLLRE
jgi:hypothetical protein